MLLYPAPQSTCTRTYTNYNLYTYRTRASTCTEADRFFAHSVLMDPPQAAFSFSLARARCVKKRTEDLYSHSVAHIVARFFERKGDTTRTAAEERASKRANDPRNATQNRRDEVLYKY